VNEKLTTAFVKFGFAADLDGLPLHGNFGAQAVQSDQTSDLHLTSAVILPDTPVVPISIVQEGAKYTDILPSMNLSIEFPQDTKLRIGVADTVARPRLDELGGGASYTVASDQATPPNYNGEFYYWARSGGGNRPQYPRKSRNGIAPAGYVTHETILPWSGARRRRLAAAGHGQGSERRCNHRSRGSRVRTSDQHAGRVSADAHQSAHRQLTDYHRHNSEKEAEPAQHQFRHR
jgi:hypothetical protein